MYEDCQDKVTTLFGLHVSHLYYADLTSKSIRNRMLAFYLVDHLSSKSVNRMLASDTGADCASRIAIHDELVRITQSQQFTFQVADEGYMRSALREEKDRKGHIRKGVCYPNSSLDKTMLVAALTMYKAGLDVRKISDEPPEPDITYLLETPAFRGTSDGADPTYAAATFLGNLPQICGMDDRILHAGSSGELRELFVFSIYHIHTYRDESRQKNLAALKNIAIPPRALCIYSALNWLLDTSKRLS